MSSFASERRPSVTDVWGDLCDSKTEAAYRRAAHALSLRTSKTAATIGATAFALGAVPDYLIVGLGPVFMEMAYLRLGVAIAAGMIFVPALTSTWVRMERTVFALGMLTAGALCWMFLATSTSAEGIAAVAGVYVLLVCGMLPIHPIRSTLIGVTTVVLGLVSAQAVHQPQQATLLTLSILLSMLLLVSLSVQVRLRSFQRIAFANYEAERVALEKASVQAEARRQAEALVSESDDNMLRLFELAPIPTVLASLTSSSTLFANRAAHRALGLPPDFDKPIRALDYYRDPAQRDGFVVALQRDGEVRGYETDMITHDGRSVLFAMSGAIVS
ncbi:MAG: hypothetical protein AAFV29_17485, partial [Myxococcota bacterium]